MTAPVRILLADDHEVVRAGYRYLLQRQPHWEVVAEADTAQAAYTLYSTHRPDIFVTDLSLPGASGLEAIRRVMALDASARIVVFTMHASPDFATAALRQGALGYVTKSSAPEVLLRAMDMALRGRQALSPDIAQALALARLGGNGHPVHTLTPREFELLSLLVAPVNVDDIAEQLHLSVKTVNNLHYQIKRKLGVANDIELTRLALSWGIGA
ncbi:MAG TPA: response regulator transcription factor [Burkholderiaceae bacterium]